MPDWRLTHEFFGDKPWAVQAEALRRSQGRRKYGYWLEQGLGKTALTFNDFVVSELPLLVVVAPMSFAGDWAAAPAEWGYPEMITAQWPRVDLKIRPGSIPQVLAINYDAVRTCKGFDYLAAIMDQRQAFLALDETSILKNPESTTTRACIELAKRAARVRALNGTPQTQSVQDWWGQLRVLGALHGVPPSVFRARYAEEGGYMGKQITGMRNENELTRLIDSVSFRALKSEWRADLPPQIDSQIRLEMTARQRAAYAQMKREFFAVVQRVEVEAKIVLTQMDKLRQISSGVLLDHGAEMLVEPVKTNPKMRAVLDLHHGGPGKSIVVHTYKVSGKALFDMCEQEGLQPAYIKGGMAPEDILEQKRRFNNDMNCRIMVTQQQAACMGHTLLGNEGVDGRCTKMIFFENSFNLRDRLQMRDRIHRGAQDQPCNYYDLFVSPMDEIVFNALNRKLDQARMIDDILQWLRLEGSPVN